MNLLAGAGYQTQPGPNPSVNAYVLGYQLRSVLAGGISRNLYFYRWLPMAVNF